MTNFIRLYPPGRKIANKYNNVNWGKEGCKQGGNWIGLKEGEILCRKCNQWKRKTLKERSGTECSVSVDTGC